MYGHARSPSMDFKELARKDATASLYQEWKKLMKTANLTEAQSQIVDKEFDGYQKLFAKFLTSESQERVIWEKIEKLHKDAVRETIIKKSTLL